jgi:hypothetical protein
MSEAEPAGDVARLKQRLGVAEAEVARLRGEAQAAADRLIAEPSPLHQRTRDELASRAELADLSAQRMKRDLAAAQVVAWREELGQLAAEHGEDIRQIGALWDRIVAGEAAMQRALAEWAPFKRRAQVRTHRARELHHLLGGEEHDQPWHTAALPKDVALWNRLARLARALEQASLPR